jgi:hypothetical protein
MNDPITEKVNEKPVRMIEKACYFMQTRLDGDTWRIHGVVDGMELMPSRPIGFDKDKNIFETKNTIYKVVSWGTMTKCIDEEFWKQVEQDIKESRQRINSYQNLKRFSLDQDH